MAKKDAAPKGELGYVIQPNSMIPGFGGNSWKTFSRNLEETEELKWPRSNRTLRLMMNDSQIQALYTMTTLPIRGYRYFINPNGCDDAIVRHVAEDFGLPIAGADDEIKRASTNGFKWKRHVYHVLKALAIGHSYFEQTVSYEKGLFRLDRLAFRPPESIDEIRTNKNGTLEMITQRSGAAPMQRIEIMENRLVPYLWDAEDGDWIGRSILRACFGDFLIKDRVKRDNAINIERGGGIPWIETEGEITGRQMSALAEVARDWKTDEDGGAALPPGSKLHIEKASAPDAVATMRYHDESMAKTFLAMFASLGQSETGSRALGDSFIDFFDVGQQAITTDLVCDPTNDIAVRRLVEWSYGPQDSLPLIEYEPTDAEVSIADVLQLARAGVIVLDPEDEAQLRRSVGLAPTKHNATDPEITPEDDPEAEGGIEEDPEKAQARRVKAAAGELPDKSTREPTESEVAAGVDFRRIEREVNDVVDAMLGTYRSEIKPAQIAEIREQIIDAGGDLSKLAEITVSVVGVESLIAHADKAYDLGGQTAIDEADYQGVTLDAGSDGDSSHVSAVVKILAVSLGLSAVSKAVQAAPGTTPTELADIVADHLYDLKDTAAEYELHGTAQQSYNGGRFDSMETATGVVADYYASELLDSATCSECADIDGKHYPTLDAMRVDYPGGYRNCLGGKRCRGTGVAVYRG